MTEHRVGVVTGTARGIGAAITERLCRDGWFVVAVDACADDPGVGYSLARPEDLDATVARCKERAVGLVGDVRRANDLSDAVELARSRFGRFDAAIAAAGVLGRGGPLWDVDDDEWDAVMDVNVAGIRRLASAAIPALMETPSPRSGRFVAIASAAATRGLRRLAAYSASKHAAVGLVRGLAADLAGTGITANAICPGSTDTAMLEASAAVYGLSDPAEFARYQLLERLLTPDEPAALVAWLCGEESSGVTGAVLAVDGGMTT